MRSRRLRAVDAVHAALAAADAIDGRLRAFTAIPRRAAAAAAAALDADPVGGPLRGVPLAGKGRALDTAEVRALP
ncbi:MAG: hypothetical protein L0H64_21065, partial [Pseudonocardia sp.]|nr:hypothetical protein [Pseudonocardia sp.]